MKQLILVRHSHAENESKDHTDFGRALTALGRDVAKQQAEILQKSSVHPDLMISSNAIRAMETAALFKDGLCFNDTVILEPFLYEEYTTQDFISYIQGLNNKAQEVMVIGHNPTISSICYRLNGEEIVSFPPGIAVVLDFNVDSWKEIEVGSASINQIFTP